MKLLILSLLLSLFVAPLHGMHCWEHTATDNTVSDEMESLLEAIRLQNHAKVHHALTKGGITKKELNGLYDRTGMRIVEGETPLTLALKSFRGSMDHALHNIFRVMQFLVLYKADVNRPNDSGETPLLLAISMRQRPWIEHWLDTLHTHNHVNNSSLVRVSRRIPKLLTGGGYSSWQEVRQEHVSVPDAKNVNTLQMLQECRVVMFYLFHRGVPPRRVDLINFVRSLNNLEEKKLTLIQMLSNQWGPESGGEPIRMHAAQQMLMFYCLFNYEVLQEWIRDSGNCRPFLKGLLDAITEKSVPRITKESD